MPCRSTRISHRYKSHNNISHRSISHRQRCRRSIRLSPFLTRVGTSQLLFHTRGYVKLFIRATVSLVNSAAISTLRCSREDHFITVMTSCSGTVSLGNNPYLGHRKEVLSQHLLLIQPKYYLFHHSCCQINQHQDM